MFFVTRMRFHSSETIVEEVAWVDTRWIKGTQLRPEAGYGWTRLDTGYGWALWPKKAMVSGSFLGELSHETYRDEFSFLVL